MATCDKWLPSWTAQNIERSFHYAKKLHKAYCHRILRGVGSFRRKAY